MTGPQRIVCLTEETTETLYLLGEEDRIVGVSVYTRRPERARKEKPAVSHFVNADIEAILALEPDLVLGFSDLQADICAELIKAGVEVYCLNHRTVAGIIEMVRRLGRLVGAGERGEKLARDFERRVHEAEAATLPLSGKPRIYFEEWPDPIITGIGWVSELIELAGGTDCFGELKVEALAKDRIVSADEVLARKPDIYLGCWCGRKFNRDVVLARPGFAELSCTDEESMIELPPEIMLQPGPAAILDGLPLLQRIVREYINRE